MFRARRTICTLIWLAALAPATETFASTDSYIEIQVDSGILAEIINRQLIVNSGFCPVDIPCPSAPQETCTVDHLEIGVGGYWSHSQNTTLTPLNAFQSIYTFEILFHQPVIAHIKTSDCVNNPACNTTQTFADMVVYELYTNPLGELCIESKPGSNLPPGVDPPETSMCIGINVEDVLQLTGQTSGDVSGVGIAISPNFSRIAIRIELGRTQSDYGDPRIDAWQDFVLGEIQPTGASSGWSVFTHQSLILGGLKARITEAVAAAPDLYLGPEVDVSWIGQGQSGGTATIQFDAALMDPCVLIIEDAALVVGTGINANHTGLVANGAFYWTLEWSQVLSCGFQLGGPIGGAVFLAMASSLSFDLASFVTGCEATGDTTFTCNQSTHPLARALGPGQSAVFHLDHVIGSDAGLAMNGALNLLGNSQLTSHVDAYDPQYVLAGGCNGPNSCDYYGGLYIWGTAPLCGVTFWNNNYNVFQITEPDDYTLPAHFSIGLVDSGSAKANAVPLYATVRTAVGAKTYAISAQGLKSDADEEQLCALFAVEKFIQCLEVEEMPWESYPEKWFCDWPINEMFDVPISVYDAQASFLDYGLVKGLDISVARDRGGIATSVLIQGIAWTGVGFGEILSQPLAISVDVPPDTAIAGDVELIRRILPFGYQATIPLDATVPPHASGGWFDLQISLEQLEAAAAQ